MKMIGLIALFFSLNAFADIGFQHGNNIEITNLRGNLTAICRANNGTNLYSYFNCSGYIASPGTHDYFMHPSIDADQVELTCVHNDGVKRTAKVRFNKEKGLSSNRVNLAVWSLFQRPLLDDGKNTVSYELKKSGKVVKTGDFSATKETVEDRQCRPHTIYFNTENDCRNEIYACDRYFDELNNCE